MMSIRELSANKCSFVAGCLFIGQREGEQRGLEGGGGDIIIGVTSRENPIFAIWQR